MPEWEVSVVDEAVFEAFPRVPLYLKVDLKRARRHRHNRHDQGIETILITPSINITDHAASWPAVRLAYCGKSH